MRRFLKWAVVVILVLFVVIQLIPVSKSNPPVTREVKWNSPDTRALAVKACFDCHSNESTWPWYASVAPVSWYLANHVAEGRDRLNFSEWDKPNEEVEKIVEEIEEGGMPPWDYKLMHPAANLTAAERDALIGGIKETTAQDPPIPGEERGEREEE